MQKVLLLLFSVLLAYGKLWAQCTNRCLDFDPATPSDYVQTTSSPVTGDANFTVEARFFCTSTGTSTRRLFAFGGSPASRFEISESGGVLRFTRQVVGGTILTSNITSPNVRDGAWHHLAATRTGVTVRVYLDGTQVYTTAGFAGALSTTTFRLGASVLTTGATIHWDGRIDEVRVWNVERTAAQINEFRLCWVPCNSTGLKAYYRFDQGIPDGNNTGVNVLEDCNDQINGILTDFALTAGNNSNWVCSNDAAFTSGTCCPAAFTIAQPGCGVVNFTNTTTGSFTYSWAFGDGGTSTQTSPSHTYATSGTYTVTLTATPVTGGAPCSVQQTITVVVDNAPPTVSCKSATINYTTGNVTITPAMVHLNSNDDCCAVVLLEVIGQATVNCADVCKVRTVTLKATDCVGNTATCTALVTVNDAQPPSAVCKNVNVGIGAPGTFTISAADVDGGSTDNCLPLMLAVTPNTFGCPVQGCQEVHTVTLTATDCAGSTSACTALVTVQDVIGPVFTNCPTSGTTFLILPPDECFIPNFLTVSATDNCDASLAMSFSMTGASNSSGPGDGQGEPLFAGFTTITYLATDNCGQTNTCTATVVVEDQQRPMVNCPPNMTVPGSLANGGAVVNWPAATATDNCFNVTLTSSAPNGSFFDCTLAGSNPSSVMYTATDLSGNTATCIFTITVLCDPICECGTFSGLTLGPKGGKTLLLACGQNNNVPCPVAGTSFEVKGNFACVGNCSPSNMTWEVKNSGGTTVASGTLSALPFTIAVGGDAMSTPGTYTLTLGADCGQTGCARCIIGLVVPDCPCPNRALDFDGVDDQVSLAPSPVSGNSDFTAETIFSCTATGTNTSCGSNFRRLIALSGPASRFEVGECGGILNIYWYDGTNSFGPTQMVPNLNVRDGVCRHIAAVRSGDNVEVFLDGVSIFTGTGVNPLNTNLFRLGQWGGGLAPGENWQGTMDEVRLWNYPRTAAEIEAFRNCPLAGSEPGLMVYWPMEQGIAEGNNPTVTQALDATTGLDHGTLNNFALSGAHSNWVCGCTAFGEGCSRADSLCGRAVVTCFSGLVGSGVNTAAPTFGIVDVRNRTGVMTGQLWTNASGANIYHPPHWNAANMGLVFGIAIDKTQNIYLSSTTVYGCPSPSFNPFGPAGAAGVYRVDPSDAITPFITTGPFNTSGTGTTIPNGGSGLGNICYDADHDQMFVTNFSDGMIYRVKGGLVTDRFDPFTSLNISSSGTGSDPDFVTLDERTWGIAYNRTDKRLYFSRWREDRGRPFADRENEIWSIGIKTTGEFNATTCSLGTCEDGEVLERKMPKHLNNYPPVPTIEYSNPVSDIAFSDKGLMLTAERSMGTDCGDAFKTQPNWYHWYAHQSRVLEFEKSGASWNLTPGHGAEPFTNYATDLKFVVGAPNLRASSGGGVDYGYNSFDPKLGVGPTECDQSVWMSADYMAFGTVTTRWYGLQGNNATGGTIYNGYIIDYDGVSGFDDKVLQGDVEIFKCLSCAELPPCDSISATAEPLQTTVESKECCYTIKISNNIPNFAASVNIQVISGGSLSYLDVSPATGWALSSFSDGVFATLSHSSGQIPVGNFACGRICLSQITASPQVIEVQYVDADGKVICKDELTLRCEHCISITQDSIICDNATGTRTMTFCFDVANHIDMFDVNSIVMTPPPNVTLSPTSFPVSDIPPGGNFCSPPITVTVAAGTNLSSACIMFTAHEQDVTKGLPPKECCMITQCFDLPDCCTNEATATPVDTSDGKCCWKISLDQPAGTAQFVTLNVIPLGSPVTIEGIGFDPNWDFNLGAGQQTVTFERDPTATLPAFIDLPTVCFDVPYGSPVPQLLEVAWSTREEVLCLDTLAFSCAADTNCAWVDSVSLLCSQPLPGHNIYTVTVTNPFFPVPPPPRPVPTHIAVVDVMPPTALIGTGIFAVGSMPPSTSKTIQIKLQGPPNSQVSFKINLYRNAEPNVFEDCCVTQDSFSVTLRNCGLPNGPQAIAIYPNPTRGHFTLEFSDPGSPAKGRVRVRDVAGRLMYEEEVPTGSLKHEVQASGLSSGLYFVEFVEDRTRVWAQKMSVVR